MQAVEDMNGPGGQWGLLQMPFSSLENVAIQISKQYYAMMQASFLPHPHDALHVFSMLVS